MNKKNKQNGIGGGVHLYSIKKGNTIGRNYPKTGSLDEIGLEEDCNIYGDHIQQCIHISPIVNNKTKSGLRSCVFDYTIFDDPHYSINYAQICNSVGNTCKTDKLSNFFSTDSNFSNSPFVNKRLNTSIPIHKRYITKIMNLSDQATVCCCNKHGCNYEFTFDLTIYSPIVVSSCLFIGKISSKKTNP
uniref:Uncharacterized protein n=1 Tax=Acrobeloides nanus TaxID=290746 RepID=A0A914C7W3_9BILA